MKNQKWVFDIEVFKNFWSIALLNCEDKHPLFFYAFDDGDTNMESWLFDELKKENLIGFNSDFYDLAILQCFASNFPDLKKATGECYKLSDAIINQKKKGFKKFKPRNHLDVKKLLRIQNSLKFCAFQMGMECVKDFDHPWTEPLPKEALEDVKRYNIMDCEITYALYKTAAPDIKLRSNYEKLLGPRVYNMDNSVFGTEYIARKIGYDRVYMVNDDATPNDLDFRSDVVFRYILGYKWYDKDLESLTNSFMNAKSIKDIKGSKRWMGMDIKLGIGGIHFAKEGMTHKGEKLLINVDVVSYYPSLIAVNDLCPKHSPSSFIREYKNLLEKRKSLDKDSPERYAVKIALNAVFGHLNFKYSLFYDPLTFLKVTVNGQILMLILTDMMRRKGLEVVYGNTDGIMALIDEKDEFLVDSVIKDFTSFTSLELERDTITKAFIRDVNNYTLVINDKIKEKGFFNTGDRIIGNNSGMAIKKAVKAHLYDGVNVRKFLLDLWEKSPKDFCLAFNSSGGAKAKYVMHGETKYDRRVYRYYVTNGGKPFKVMYERKSKGRTVDLLKAKEEGYKVELVDYLSEMKHPPNWQYYENESKKIISLFNSTKLL